MGKALFGHSLTAMTVDNVMGTTPNFLSNKEE
jgi:hypothetical protein